MKSYVVDANVIFSGVVSGKEMYVRAFAANSFYTPDFALDEIRKYQELILKKTKLPPEKTPLFYPPTVFKINCRSEFSHFQ